VALDNGRVLLERWIDLVEALARQLLDKWEELPLFQPDVRLEQSACLAEERRTDSTGGELGYEPSSERVQPLVVEQSLDEQCATVAFRFDEQGEDGFLLVAKVGDHVCAEEGDKRSRGGDALGRRFPGGGLQALRMNEITMVVSGEWDEHGVSRHRLAVGGPYSARALWRARWA
jgi:hypothetical protein